MKCSDPISEEASGGGTPWLIWEPEEELHKETRRVTHREEKHLLPETGT